MQANADAGPSSHASIAAAAPSAAEVQVNLSPDSPNAFASGSTPTEPSLTKSAAKRLARRAHFESTKLARRASEKDRRKANAAKLKEDIAAGNLDEEELAEAEAKRARHTLKRKLHQSRNKNGGTLVALEGSKSFKGGLMIDLEFDSLMTPAEIKSMSTQLGYVYNSNRQSTRPFRQVVMTGMKEGTALRQRLEEQLEGQYRSWTGMRFMDEDLKELFMDHPAGKMDAEELMHTPQNTLGQDRPEPTSRAPDAPEPAPDATTIETHNDSTLAGPSKITLPESSLPSPSLNPFPGQTYVYLTADSPDEITELSEGETYVIGGIVDRNRYKFLCQNKAEKMGMRTARLPIGTYLANMPTRKVLTVNQVFDILLKYNELGSWQSALEEVMPIRKFHEGRKAKTAANRAGKSGSRDSDEEQQVASDDEDEEEQMMTVDGDDEAHQEIGLRDELDAGGNGDMAAEAEEMMNG